MVSVSANSLSVLLVDDHTVVRAGLSLILQKDPLFRIVGEAANSAEALTIAQRERPDIILLDLDLGDENGQDLIPVLQETAGNARIVVLTGSRDEHAHHQAVAAGALGVVSKSELHDVVVTAIKRVHAGEAWLSPRLTANLVAHLAGHRNKKANPETVKIASLSKRELEIVQHIGDGLKSREIAERLFISEITVRHHLTSIFAKLEVSDRVELMLYAYKNNLAKAPLAA